MSKNKKSAGRPIQLASPWGELAQAVGGTLILAEKFGVAGTTLNRWANGIHEPSELTKREVRNLCKQFKIKNSI